MRILVEHIVFAPFRTSKITGGVERFVHLSKKALESIGHTCDFYGTADSEDSCIKSSVNSTEHQMKLGKMTNFKGWYEGLAQHAKNYDAVLLAHPITSASITYDHHAEWQKKAVYLNHNSYGWMEGGQEGQRLQTSARWFRKMGGRCFYVGELNRNTLAQMWQDPVFGLKVRQHISKKMVETHGTEWRESIDLFDGFFDVNCVPDDFVMPTEIGDHIVATGRPDSVKQLIVAAKAMKGMNGIIFTNSVNESDRSGEAAKIIEKLKKTGADVRLDRPHSEIMKTVSTAKAFMFPSKQETSGGIASFEPFAHGVPVIYTTDTADYYLKTGAHVKTERTPQAFAEAVKQIDQTLEQRLAQVKTVADKYSIENLGRRLEAELTR